MGVGKRSHNLGGCGTCRRRHIKCDRKRPTCTHCRTGGHQCEGFQPRIRWASLSTATPDRQTTDVKVHNDSARNPDGKRDSPRTTSSANGRRSTARVRHAVTLASSSVGATLSELDTIANDDDRVHDGVFTAGPFSVLDFQRPSKDTPQSDLVNASATQQQNHVVQTVEKFPTPDLTFTDSSLGLSIGPPTAESTSGLLGTERSDLDSLLDVSNALDWNDLFDTGFDFTPIAHEDWQNYDDPLHLLAHVADGSRAQTFDGRLRTPEQSSPAQTTTITDSEVLAVAPLLLMHFQETIVPAFGPVPMPAKSPWNICVTSAAVQVFADLTYLRSKSVKFATKAIFYAVLAVSAWHARHSNCDRIKIDLERLDHLHTFCFKSAQRNLKQSLLSETSGPQKAKYKDQLMAIMCLNAVVVHVGLPEDARCYLIDAERLVRSRGLSKSSFSRRARLLHHLYTWLRIVGESTFVIHDYTNFDLVRRIETYVRNGMTGDGRETSEHEQPPSHNTQLDDFLRPSRQDDESDTDTGAQKDPETGLRDIHLEDMRHYAQTMYSQVYGIPEQWLSLVSQTTRLANITDILEASKGLVNGKTMATLQRKISRLEQMICTFAADATESTMLQAMNSAMVIFFYRRIRKVHPWILQSHVQTTINALKAFDKVLIERGLQGPGTPWPAFIAGCEASTGGDREFFESWLTEAGRQLCSESVAKSLEVMKEVWRRRDPAGKSSPSSKSPHFTNIRGGVGCSWVDVLKEQKLWLVLF